MYKGKPRGSECGHAWMIFAEEVDILRGVSAPDLFENMLHSIRRMGEIAEEVCNEQIKKIGFEDYLKKDVPVAQLAPEVNSIIEDMKRAPSITESSAVRLAFAQRLETVALHFAIDYYPVFGHQGGIFDI